MPSVDSCADRLGAQFAAKRHLCVGLDTDPARVPSAVHPAGSPADRVVAFNKTIIDHTADTACAYKPNVAFYEALGSDGFRALAATVAAIRARAPDIPVIVDAKRGDIGSTNLGYVQAVFDQLDADAITVHPYLGKEALRPFLDRTEKLMFVLARTSNPGAGEFQDLGVGDVPLYRHVARAVALDWNDAGNCGLVVGATYPAELALVREDVPRDMPILVPGVGAQGGDIASVIDVHRGAGSSAFLINASRSILYADSGPEFGEAARAEAQRLDNAIQAALAER